MPDAAPDLRADLDAAFDAAVEAPPSVPEPAPAPEVAEEAPPASDKPQTAQERARDEAGRFAKAAEEKAAAEEATKAPEPAKEAAKAPTGDAAKAVISTAFKPPQSWKPAAREALLKAPPEVQAEVTRREAEITQALRESSEARQGYQKYREAVQPFEQMIRAEGGEPVAAIQGLLQTAYALRHAPEHVKADMIAKMVTAYLPGQRGLELLDRRLVGEALPQQSAQQGQQFRDPRVDELLQRLESVKQAEAQTTQQRAAELVAAVQDREFYGDLRESMADILEVASRRGLSMTLEAAYDKAAALDPEISRVLSQREEAGRLANPNGSTQRARNASSSLRSNPATPPSGDRKAGDLRADLEAAFSSNAGNR